jgi:hypothetical protein
MTMNWWFILVGVLMMVGAVLDPKAGVQFTRGRPDGRTEVEPTFAVRASTFLIGLLLVGFGFSKLF